MVDEDRDTYTFREKLYEPKEFKLKRSEILFIAEKNPSGLDGKAETDRIHLKWLPPYNKVKYYTVYVKTSKKTKYEPAEKTDDLSLTLKNLKSKTVYWFIVTATDNDNYESLPSNELKISTRSIKPESPNLIASEKGTSADGNTCVLNIKWDEAADPDGGVKKYRLYGVKNNKKEKIAEIKKRDYEILNFDAYDKIELVAVDNTNDESEPVKITKPEQISIGFSPGIILPIGKFAKMAKTGYGGTFTFIQNNVLFSDFETGLSVGCYYMEGKNLLDEKNKIYETLFFAPLCLSAGYNLMLKETFSIKPVISAGGAYLDVKYKDAMDAGDPDKKLRVFEPVIKAGISVSYMLSESFSFSAGCEYGVIIEKSGILNFAVLNAGAVYSF